MSDDRLRFLANRRDPNDFGQEARLRGVPASDDLGGDRATRARGLADAFAARFPPTLPPPGSEVVPGPGRHVRCSAETPGQIYVVGQTYVRDARARIAARASGMPANWCVRLSILDARLTPLNPSVPGSRADPVVLRAQRQMADPAAAAALASPLRVGFPGRPIQSEMHSLFVPTGLIFVREVSVAVPMSDRADDDADLLRRLCEAALAAAPGPVDQRHHDAAAADGTRLPPPNASRRGHLRIVQ